MRLGWLARSHAISSCFHGCPLLLLSPNWNSLVTRSCKVGSPKKISRISLHWKFTHGQKSHFKGFCFQVVSHIPDFPRRCSLLPCWAPKRYFWTSITDNFLKSNYLLSTYYMPHPVHYIHTGSYSILPATPKSGYCYYTPITNEETRLREILKTCPQVT